MSSPTRVDAQRELGGRISRFLVNVKKLGKDAVSVAVLKRRRKLLEDYWKEFSGGHREITIKTSTTDPYFTEDYYAEVEEDYLTQGAALDDWIETLTTASTEDPASCHGSLAPRDSEPALPTINLPSFGGDLFQWESFRDQFASLVHNSPRLSKVRNFQYLKSCLTGEASKMPQLTPVTENNYDGAWASLERRFGNRRILSAAHMRRLITTPPAAKSNPSELKRLLDEFRQTQEALRALDKPVKEWDEWFLFLMVEKLDQSTRLDWEVSLVDPIAIPPFDALERFLENRVHALASARIPESAVPRPTGYGQSRSATASRSTMALKIDTDKKSRQVRQCPLCSGTHLLGGCSRFKAMSAKERHDFVRTSGVCLSCLGSGHSVRNCTSSFRCWVCGEPHHTTLHDAVLQNASRDKSASQPTPSCSSYTVSARKVTLLATARVLLQSPDGRILAARALLDSGSECSFLSEWAAQSLRLRRRPVRVELTGYQGTKVGVAKSEVQVQLRSPRNDRYLMPLVALVTKNLTAPTPSQPVDGSCWDHVAGLPLADPSFTTPGPVDVLLGADVCGSLLQKKIEGPPGTPVAVQTPFGWTLLGPAFGSEPGRTTRVLHCARQEKLPDLQRFWELEEVPTASPMTPDEVTCERLFQKTTFRDDAGRFVVRLPFRTEPIKVGSSRVAAMRLLLSSERRQDHGRRQMYEEFMEEYRLLGHMTAVQRPLGEEDGGYYIPHHAVWKDADGLRKIRVVFNASCRSSLGSSLNDALLPGPKLQSDLWAVVTRWRLFKTAFAADIVKMFRQIRIHPDDQDWLRILWRKHLADPVTEYRLTTVTYGTAPAPYLAHRVLRQLASDGEDRFPLASQVLRDNIYVDDILAGADNVDEANEIKEQLINLLSSAGFPLDKWASSDTRLHSTLLDHKVFQEPEVHGALGLRWDTVHDTLSVRGASEANSRVGHPWTKRSILSEIARLFDPMGWLTPVFVTAKVLLQDLWLAGVTWDEPISPDLTLRWNAFRQQIPHLDGISVPRWTQFSPTGCTAELHGFCDASERAYATAVYLVVHRPSGSTSCLLMAKSRVAPTKILSIPRLELCGAVLLVRLLAALSRGLGLLHLDTYAWTDSTVVLAWLQSHPSRWKPFVAHRVAEVQNATGVSWRHVGTHENPADLATRGISGQELHHSGLWWSGPSWICDPPNRWPQSGPLNSCNLSPEERRVTVMVARTTKEETPYLQRFSTLNRLVRITAQIRRFVSRCRNPEDTPIGHLTTAELRDGLLVAIRLSQESTFPEELERLRKGLHIPVSSPLKALCPFLALDNVLRVEGRLHHTTLGETRRHPAILQRTSHLATLVLRDAHLKTLHGGVNATIAWTHRAFWIPRVRTRAKQILHDCVTCTRMRATTGQQRMGHLPSARVQPSKPFARAGVDYAGPFPLRTAKGRGHTSQKGYVVVFVCMSTKAVHLDAVTDLSSPAFLAAFHRFVARRGRCNQMFSDNASTFRGANSLLQQMFRSSSQFYRTVAATLANEGTDWSFIPPYSPHMGGLWEAAVKSMKTHLRKVIGEATLTYEEMTTLLCRIEACLNSRPLTPLSEDTRDLEPLTPSHFLIGERVHSPPEPPVNDNPIPLTSRWKLISNMHQHFWHRWSQEYMHHMQPRNKWSDRRDNLCPGQLVLVKSDLTPPTRWPLATVETLHPGSDGLVRVVTLRRGQLTFDRAVAKLVPLSIHQQPSLSD